MCGICGVWSPSGQNSPTLTKSLMSEIEHRGPDDSGIVDFQQSNLSLGHVRLSIIDLDGSPQPMTSANKRFTIVFNGEIYNYEKLRAELNYPFQTSGDTETILALWEKEGPDCLPKLRGQFAFVIWDSESEILSFATDAFGILPIFVYDNGNTLAFSSSANSLSSQFPEITKDLEKIETLLTTRAVVAPETAYSGVRRLPPGSFWTYGKEIKKECFWHQSWNDISASDSVSQAEKVKEIVQLLNLAADRAITSDVEVGVFLSGGLDSALIAKLAQDRLSYQMNAYTAFWPDEKKSSELDQASITARELGLKHHQIAISADDWWDGFLESSKFREGPHAEPADVVFYLLAERAKQDVKVVLTGEGADELFGGYPKNRLEQFASLSLVNRLASILLPTRIGSGGEKLGRILYALSERDSSVRWSRYFSTYWKSDFDLEPNTLPDSELYDPGVRGMRVFDFTQWLAPLLLDRADQMAMAHGLEVRPMLLSYDLANFAFTLNESDLHSGGQTKPLLRKAAKLILPSHLSSSPKRGFPIPISEWFAGPLYDKVERVLEISHPALDLVVPVETRIRLLQEEKRNPNRNSKKLFTLVSVITWLNQ